VRIPNCCSNYESGIFICISWLSESIP
jgi:hypothetical protein